MIKLVGRAHTIDIETVNGPVPVVLTDRQLSKLQKDIDHYQDDLK